MLHVTKIRNWVVAHIVWIAAVIITVLVAGGIWVLVEVWRSDRHEFWAIAVPGTLTGIGTLALALGTVGVLVGDQSDRRAAQQDRRDAQEDRRIAAEDRRRRDEQERRAQAAQVQVSLPADAANGGNFVPSEAVEQEVGRRDTTYVGERPESYVHTTYRVFVINRSADVISKVRVLFAVAPSAAVVGGGTVDEPVVELRRLGTGVELPAATGIKLGVRDQTRHDPVEHEVLAWVIFRDSAGLWWLRDPDHGLAEITEQVSDELAEAARHSRLHTAAR
jgi:hypothetical protein